MRSGNPVLSDRSFDFGHVVSDNTMTLQGTVTKTGLLLALVIVGAAITWPLALSNPSLAFTLAIGGAISGFICALVIVFKPTAAPWVAPVYGLVEGLFLGALSSVMEAQFPGIVPQAVGLTFGTTAALLIAYSTRLIRPTENFKLGIAAATGGIMLVYLATFILNMFGTGIPFIHGSGWIGIGFSLFVVVIAALNLVLDFDFIESGAERGAPKYMEWYGAFGLMVTLIWLYIEILRLLAKLQSRD